MHPVHNARVQLAATAFNNLGIGAIVLRLSPVGTGHVLEWWYIAAWTYLAAGLFSAGQFIASVAAMSLETYWLVVPLVSGTVVWAIVAAMWLAQRRGKPHKPAE